MLKVHVRAMNGIWSLEVDVDLEDILQACRNHSDVLPDGQENKVCWIVALMNVIHYLHVSAAHWLFFYPQTDVTTDVKIIAFPDTLIDYNHNITLSVAGIDSLLRTGLAFEWQCGKCIIIYLTCVDQE